VNSTIYINLVPRACDPREGTRGSGIIRFREESDWPLKRSSILGPVYMEAGLARLARQPGKRDLAV
jgi:hypothetical protein